MRRKVKGRFTAYPKWWRVFIPILGNAELRVLAVIVEQTAGWGRTWTKPLSLRDIAAMSGLHKSNVPKALMALMDGRVVALRIQDGRKTYCLRDLRDEATWAHYATRVAQRVQQRSHKAYKRGALRDSQQQSKSCRKRASGDREKLDRDISRNSKKRGEKRRSSLRVSEDISWAVERWSEKYGHKPAWPKKAYPALTQTVKKLNGTFRSAWTAFLAEKGDFYRGHSPMLFIANPERWRGTQNSTAASGKYTRVDIKSTV